MKYRTLGKTGWRVSEIGFGAWGIGGAMWQGGDDDTALQALHAALDAGCTFIDTALAYGDGHSERLIAQVLAERPEAIIVASKIPPDNGVWPALPGTPLKAAFPADYVRDCAERSAENLNRPVDLLQFHVWEDEWAEDARWQRVMEELKREGKVRAFGVSINRWEPWNGIRTLKTGLVDAVLIATPHYFHTSIGIDALGQGLHGLLGRPARRHHEPSDAWLGQLVDEIIQ